MMTLGTPTTELQQTDLTDEPSAKAKYSGIAVVAAVALFVATRLYLLLFFASHSTDLTLYFTYAVRGVDFDQQAYRDFPVEYPPLAYWAITLPRVVSSKTAPRDMFENPGQVDYFFGNYVFGFRGLMLLADILSFVLCLAIVGNRRPSEVPWAAWGYLAITLPLAHVLYDRLDLLLLLLLLLWAYGYVRSFEHGPLSVWNLLAYTALGLSIPYKLVGIVIVPFVIAGDVLSRRRRQDAISVAAVLSTTCLLAAAVPFVMQGMSSGASTFDFLRYHSQRGIEIESTHASLLLGLAQFGMPVSSEWSYGSANLVSPLSKTLAAASTVMLLVVLAALGFSAFVAHRRFDRVTAYRAGLLAILLTLICSKVLSAQYFVFALPLLLLLALEVRANRQMLVVVAILFLATLTTIVFPYLFFQTFYVSHLPNPYCLVPDLHPLPCALLAARNMLFVGLVAWLWRGLTLADVADQPC